MSLHQINYKFQSFLNFVENNQITKKIPITNEIMEPWIVDLHNLFDIHTNFQNEPDKEKETFRQLAERFRKLKSEFDKIEIILKDDIRILYQNLILHDFRTNSIFQHIKLDNI